MGRRWKAFTKEGQVIAIKDDEKKKLVALWEAGELSVEELSVYGIRRKTINSWKHKELNGRLRGKSGRPRIVDEATASILEQHIESGTYNKLVGSCEDIVNACHKANQKKRGILTMTRGGRQISIDDFQVHPKTLASSISKINNAKKPYANAQAATDARAQAGLEKQSFIGCAAALFAMANIVKVPRQLWLNCDATQFEMSSKNSRNKAVKKKGQNTSTHPVTIHENVRHALATFVKWFPFISAMGFLTPSVYIVADPSVPENEIHAVRVPGLGITTDPLNNYGYVVFSNTRVPPVKFYEWVLKEICIPFVQNIRLTFNMSPDAPAVVVMDGESNQIYELIHNAELKDLLALYCIYVIKMAASLTHKLQACDSKMFRAIKSRLKGILPTMKLDDDAQYYDSTVERALLEAWGEHAKKGFSFPTNKKAPCIEAILRIRCALQLTITPQLIQKGFELTGNWQDSRQHQGPNYETVLRLCDASFSISEETRIMADLPKLAEHMLRHGEISDEAMRGYGYSYDTDIDHLVETRRRSIILTNTAFHEAVQMREAVQAEEEQNDATRKAEKKRLAEEKRTAKALEKVERAKAREEVKRRREEAQSARALKGQKKRRTNIAADNETTDIPVDNTGRMILKLRRVPMRPQNDT